MYPSISTANEPHALPRESASTPPQAWRDWLGIGASVLCAIHCAAMPFVVGLLPLIGLSFLADPAFHKWMVGICLGLALLAFVPGWRRHHRLSPTVIGVTGLLLITVAAFAGPDDCCPTPGSDSPSMAAAPVGEGEETACTASYCPTEVGTVAVRDPEPNCAASCCPTETEPPVGTTACATACCPDENGRVVAGSQDAMGLFWLLMTPIGGVILVAAHLRNHACSRHCKAACCIRPTSERTRG